MKIEQILMQPIGTRINPGTLSIKTFKKTWQVGEIWWSQVILMDGTGEIPADVNVGKTYNPIRGRGQKINIIVAEVQEAEYLGKNRKKLVIDQYTMPSISMAEYEESQDQMENELKLIVQGKIRHGEVCKYMGAGIIHPKMNKLELAEVKESILYWQEFVITGE